MKNFRRTYLLTALALCALMAAGATAYAASNKSAVKSGGSWLGRTGMSSYPGTGFKADAVSAIVVARRAGTKYKDNPYTRFLKALRSEAAFYAQGAGPTGKLILAVVALNQDPRCFGPTGELVNLQKILMSDYNEKTGQFGETVYDQALAMLALKASRERIPSKAISFAEGRRGQYGWGFALKKSGGDDVESTGIMIEALRAAGRGKNNKGLRSAYRWITYQRNADGGYNPDAPNAETQADTTSYAIRAADALGINNTKAKSALRALQQKNGAIRSTPGVQGEFMGISTTNGVIALGGQHYPVVVRKKRSTCTKVV